MPKVLTEQQVRDFEEQGYLSPIRAMSTERAAEYRRKFEALEARFPNDMKKMKTKSHLLCPWVLDIAEDPHTLDIFEDLIGPNIRCWSMAWRVKKADAQTIAGWHQDSVYGSPVPVVLGALALSACGADQGCLWSIPGSHKWGHLKHEESDDPKSILARGQYISDPFDESKAVDFVLQPGEMVMFYNSLIHGSSINVGPRPALPPPRRDGAHVGGATARPRVRHAPAWGRYARQVRRRAAAGRRVHRDGAGELEARGGRPGQAALRRQPLCSERGLRRRACRDMTTA